MIHRLFKKVLSQTVSFFPFNEKVLVYVFLEKVALLMPTSTHFMVVGEVEWMQASFISRKAYSLVVVCSWLFKPVITSLRLKKS